jgi:hypothetical protein
MYRKRVVKEGERKSNKKKRKRRRKRKMRKKRMRNKTRTKKRRRKKIRRKKIVREKRRSRTVDLLEEVDEFPHAGLVPGGTEDFLLEGPLLVELQQHHLGSKSDLLVPQIRFVCVCSCVVTIMYRVFRIICLVNCSRSSLVRI